MKEFQSTTGGRHVYNTDFKNLQELALAMQELFRSCGGNFVISGCEIITGDNTISVSDGYVYIGGKVRQVSAVSGLSASNLYIVPAQRNGESIPYADGNNSNQYIEYYAEIQNASSVSGEYIAYDSSSNTFPNLATVFFNYYAVCKRIGNQSIDNLAIQQTLSVAKSLIASQGLSFDSTNTKIYKDNNSIFCQVGDYYFVFDSNGAISIKTDEGVLLSFSETTGSGWVTFGSVKVTQRLETNKLYIDGIDIENKLVPLGMIHIWAGSADKLPENYLLCNGQAINQSDYPELYSVIGSTFNVAANSNGEKWSAPSSGMFRLPDLQGRFIVGYSSSNNDYRSIANTGGETKHALSQGEMPSHTHLVQDYYGVESSKTAGEYKNKNKLYGGYKLLDSTYYGIKNGDEDNDSMLYSTHNTGFEGNGDAHENRPPYYVLAYIMRAK